MDGPLSQATRLPTNRPPSFEEFVRIADDGLFFLIALYHVAVCHHGFIKRRYTYAYSKQYVSIRIMSFGIIFTAKKSIGPNLRRWLTTSLFHPSELCFTFSFRSTIVKLPNHNICLT